MATHELRVLLVEDNPADVVLLKEAFRESGFACDITLASDGSLALEILRRTGAGADAPTPDLIILDLNLPKMGGFMVLAEARKDRQLATIPVIVLSTSKAARDIDQAEKLGADRYLSKASNYADTLRLAREIRDFCRFDVDQN